MPARRFPPPWSSWNKKWLDCGFGRNRLKAVLLPSSVRGTQQERRVGSGSLGGHFGASLFYPTNARPSLPAAVVRRGCASSASNHQLISTPIIIGSWIDIDWLNNRRCRNPIAFGSHALRINGVISRLQGATSGASIPCSYSTARD
jgi:hypothetical protein